MSSKHGRSQLNYLNVDSCVFNTFINKAILFLSIEEVVRIVVLLYLRDLNVDWPSKCKEYLHFVEE